MLLLWPVIAVHPITAESPLYGISAESLIQEEFEIIVTLEGTTVSTNMEGTTVSTNMAAQAVTSYLPNEILWGYRFEEKFSLESSDTQPIVDSSHIDEVYSVNTPAKFKMEIQIE